MAINTALKRLSVIGVGSALPRGFPLPDGIVDSNERAVLGFNYSGLDAPPLPSGVLQWWNLMLTPYSKGIPITASDTVNFTASTGVNAYGSQPACDAIFVGGAGNVVAVFQDSTTATFAAGAGEILPIRAIRVNATNTTASSLVALYWV